MRRARLTVPAALLAAALLAAAPPAHAQSTESEAQALFQAAREAMSRGDYAVACAKLERSDTLDHGIGTEFNLGRCYELSGRLASAWATYRRVVNETEGAGESRRADVTRSLMVALEPRLAHVTLVVAPQVGPPGLELRLDGATLEEARWATPVAVDPGEHEVQASAPTRQPFVARFRVDREAQQLELRVPPLGPSALGPSALAPSQAPTSPPPRHEDAAATPGKVQRLAAYGAGVLGLVGAGIGSGFGIRALSLANQANPHCDGASCDATGISLRNSSIGAGNTSTVSFVTAGVLVAAAVVLFLTAPSASGDAR